MKIIYDSLTGQGKTYALSVVKNLAERGIDFVETQSVYDYEPFNESGEVFLITRCYNFGDVTDRTLDFLEDMFSCERIKDIKGVSVTGNLNWGVNFGKAGYTIEKDYNVPLVHIFEFSGYPEDVEITADYIYNLLNKKDSE